MENNISVTVLSCLSDCKPIYIVYQIKQNNISTNIRNLYNMYNCTEKSGEINVLL